MNLLALEITRDVPSMEGSVAAGAGCAHAVPHVQHRDGRLV